MRTMQVAVKDLGVTYPISEGTLTVIDDFDLHVQSGQMVCLAGRSGSGKTSILKALAGFHVPTVGSVTWNGTDLRAMSPAEVADLRREHVGYMDQEAALLPELTALKNCLVPILPDGRQAVRRARVRAREMLEALGLGERLGWRPAQLSGGERQRLVLARVFTQQTPAIIADEPTASLDRTWADRVIEHLRNHAHQGGLVVVASHDPAVSQAANQTMHLT